MLFQDAVVNEARFKVQWDKKSFYRQRMKRTQNNSIANPSSSASSFSCSFINNRSLKKTLMHCQRFLLKDQKLFKVWKSKTRVTSCQLRVQICELRVQINELRVEIHELQATINANVKCL